MRTYTPCPFSEQPVVLASQGRAGCLSTRACGGCQSRELPLGGAVTTHNCTASQGCSYYRAEIPSPSLREGQTSDFKFISAFHLFLPWHTLSGPYSRRDGPWKPLG